MTTLLGLSAFGQDHVIYRFQRTDGAIAEIVKPALDVLVELDPEIRCSEAGPLLVVVTSARFTPIQIERHLEEGIGALFTLWEERVIDPDVGSQYASDAFQKWRVRSEPIPADTPHGLLVEYGVPMPAEVGDSAAAHAACSSARKRWITDDPDRYRSFREAYNTIEQ
jgi:hypothetical protein